MKKLIFFTTPQSLLHIHNSATEECPPMIVVPMLGGVGPFTCSSSRLQLTNLNSGSSASDGLLLKTTNNNAEIHLQEAGTLKLYSGSNDNFALKINNGFLSLGEEILYINSNGKIGISTYNPRERTDRRRICFSRWWH